MKRSFILLIALAFVFTLASLSQASTPAAEKESGTQVKNATPVKNVVQPKVKVTIKLATTTSLDSTGLLDALLPVFLEKTGIAVDVIAVGSGKAMEHGRAGDVDVLVVHSPDDEKKFMEEGYGKERIYICQNEFVIVGPKSDPAGISKVKTAAEAFSKIAESKSFFISRGDQSGTNAKELKIWKEAGITPSGDWYIESGQGMSPTLIMADEKLGYTLTDNATYYSMIDKLELPILFSGDPKLLNIYRVITLNPEKNPNVKYKEALNFARWITGPEAEKIIRDFTANGHKLFKIENPDKIKPSEEKSATKTSPEEKSGK